MTLRRLSFATASRPRGVQTGRKLVSIALPFSLLGEQVEVGLKCNPVPWLTVNASLYATTAAGMSASPGGREVGCREWGQVWPVTRETVVSFLYKLHYSVGPPILCFDARDRRLLGERLPWQGTFELNRARSGRGRKASEAQTLTAWLGSIGPGRNSAITAVATTLNPRFRHWCKRC